MQYKLFQSFKEMLRLIKRLLIFSIYCRYILLISFFKTANLLTPAADEFISRSLLILLSVTLLRLIEFIK